jgi:hypothetical protein
MATSSSTLLAARGSPGDSLAAHVNITVVTLGTATRPTGLFMLLPVVGLVTVIPGMPCRNTLGLPIVNMPICLKSGLATPGSSPIVMGIIEPMLSAGIIVSRMVGQKGAAIACMPMFGYGIGMGLGAAGVRHTSGNPMFIPAPLLVAGSISRGGSAGR